MWFKNNSVFSCQCSVKSKTENTDTEYLALNTDDNNNIHKYNIN